MGGNSPSTVQSNGNPLATLFAGSQGYQQPQMPQQGAPPPPAIQQPSYGMPAMTPQQAALATQARMLARTPLVPPPIAQPQPMNNVQRGGEGNPGGGGRGAASGGNGNGWGGH